MTEQSWSKGAPPERWWALYMRVTREESVAADLSIPNQIARAKEIAALRGWTAWKVYVEPRHVSAELWTDKRPALRELLADVAAGRVIGVCARHTDRLWRNNEIQGRVLRALRERGCELWDFTNKYDYRSAHGRFSLQVLGAASELEVNLTAERIREMKRGKAMKGKLGGGPPPFGYTSQSRRFLELQAEGLSKDEAYRQACVQFPVGKCWYVDEREAEIVRLMFELYTSPRYRYGCKRIVHHLNGRGHKTRHGREWLSNYVIKLINNPVYAGFTSFDERAYEEKMPSRLPRREQSLYQGEHPPIVSAELWQKAQTIKTSENTVKRRHRDTPSNSEFTLTGLIRCPRCGCRMIGKARAGSTRRYYICSRRHTGGPDLCSFPLVDASRLQAEVWNWIHEIVASPAFVMEHMARLQKKLDAEQPETRKRTAILERRRDEIRAATSKYLRLFESSKDADSDATMLDRVRELRAEQTVVDAELAELSAQAPPPHQLTVERVRHYLDRLRSRLEANPQQQRALFHEFKREHGLQVRAVSPTEFTISIALPMRELADASEVRGFTPTQPLRSERMFSVVAGTQARGGSKEPRSGKPGTIGPSIALDGSVRVTRETTTVSQWVESENAKGHHCQCGCGKPIRVLPQHHSQGIPRYIRTHHPMAMTREVESIRAEGLLTVQQAASQLGIGETTLRRLEGQLFEPPPRRGKRRIRVFTTDQVKQIAAALRKQRKASERRKRGGHPPKEKNDTTSKKDIDSA